MRFYIVASLPDLFDLLEVLVRGEISIVLDCELEAETVEAVVHGVDLEGVVAGGGVADNQLVDVYPVEGGVGGGAKGIQGLFGCGVGQETD